MRCPFCSQSDTQVKDSRPSEDDQAVRRRRLCNSCGGRFTTFERVQLREVIVLKSDGKAEPFDRDKLHRSIAVALRKRSIEAEQVEHIVNGIVRQIENMGDAEVESSHIGSVVMDVLREIDQVAYIRFASVYRDFTEVSDFQSVLDEFSRNKEGALQENGETYKQDDVNRLSKTQKLSQMREE